MCTQWHTRYLWTHTPTHSKNDKINVSLEILKTFNVYYMLKKNCLDLKTTCIGKLLSYKIIYIENLLHILNCFAFRIVLDIWCKLMYDNLLFILKKNYENWLYSKGYSNKKCDIGIFTYLCNKGNYKKVTQKTINDALNV
jgi:hypothetical protein